jgi:hypothetical protein
MQYFFASPDLIFQSDIFYPLWLFLRPDMFLMTFVFQCFAGEPPPQEINMTCPCTSYVPALCIIILRPFDRNVVGDAEGMS